MNSRIVVIIILSNLLILSSNILNKLDLPIQPKIIAFGIIFIPYMIIAIVINSFYKNIKQMYQSRKLDQFKEDIYIILDELLFSHTVREANINNIDIKVFKDWKLQGIVQCRLYPSNYIIQIKDIDNIFTPDNMKNIKFAYLFTTSKISESAYSKAKEKGIKIYGSHKINNLRNSILKKNNIKSLKEIKEKHYLLFGYRMKSSSNERSQAQFKYDIEKLLNEDYMGYSLVDKSYIKDIDFELYTGKKLNGIVTCKYDLINRSDIFSIYHIKHKIQAKLAVIFIPTTVSKSIQILASSLDILICDVEGIQKLRNSINISHISPHVLTLYSTPAEFELAMGEVLSIILNLEAKVIGGSGDEGVDIELYKYGRLVGIAQCKYYASYRTIPPSAIRELVGTKKIKKLDKAFLLTTARASVKTHELARSTGIELIDGELLDDLKAQAYKKARRY